MIHRIFYTPLIVYGFKLVCIYLIQSLLLVQWIDTVFVFSIVFGIVFAFGIVFSIVFSIVFCIVFSIVFCIVFCICI